MAIKPLFAWIWLPWWFLSKNGVDSRQNPGGPPGEPSKTSFSYGNPRAFLLARQVHGPYFPSGFRRVLRPSNVKSLLNGLKRPPEGDSTHNMLILAYFHYKNTISAVLALRRVFELKRHKRGS